MNHTALRQQAYNFADNHRNQWWCYVDVPKGIAGDDFPRRWREVRGLFNYKTRIDDKGRKQFLVISRKRMSRAA